MNEHKQSRVIDWTGIVLFAFGALGTVVMMLSLSATREQHGPMVTYAETWKAIFGSFPSLFLNAAFLFLGARLFLKRDATQLFRNLAGCALLTVALSVFFGALSTGAGGTIGAHTGEIVTTRAHIALGALVGLVAIFAAAWFGWLRHTGMGRAYAAPAPMPAPAETKPAKVVARPIAPPMPTRLSTPQTAAAEEGVTAAESAALFPMEEVAPVSDPVARAEASEAAPVLARSPYPDDVRRMGQVPPGAKPLEVPAVPAPSAYRWTAPRTESEEAAEEDTVREPVASGFSVHGLRPLPRIEDEIEAGDVEASEVEAETAGALDVEEVDAAPLVPVPSWEQPALFRPEAGDEEPVDAYGTPLTLVEKLREARRIGGLEPDDTRVVDDLAHEELEEIPAPVASITSEELDVLMEDEVDEVAADVDENESDEELDAEEDEIQPVRAQRVPREIDEDVEPVLALDDDEEDVDEDADGDLETDEIEADGPEEDAVSDEPIVVAAEIGSFDEDTLDDDDEVDAEAGDIDDDVFAEPVPVEEDLVAPAMQAAAEPVLEPLALPSVNVAPIRTEKSHAEPIQPGLFDAPIAAAAATPAPTAARVEAPAPKPAPQPKPARAPAPAEKEVVLQPVAATPTERSVKSTSPDASSLDATRQSLLSDIGCLFIERGRVAVSMLQRQHGMDFDEACKVLDDLQEMGLIGPYLGGQRRDILLTREQWLERVSQAGAAR